MNLMKVIIAGTRTITNPVHVEKAMTMAYVEGIVPDEVFSGCANGVDKLGEAWAKARNIPIRSFPAAWHQYGNAAGPMRNHRMALQADALVLIWDGESRGSANMLHEATMAGLQIYQYIVKEDNK